MNIALWVCQGLLAVIFFYSGVTKGFRQVPDLVRMGQTGVQGLNDKFVNTIGIAELFGVAGIILPWLLQIAPVLTPVTALCFALVMVFSIPIHFRQKNYFQVFTHVLVLGASLLVAVGRWIDLR